MFLVLAPEIVEGAGVPNVFYAKGEPDDLTGELQKATVFTLEIVEGKPRFTPRLPKGDWRVCGVEYNLI